MKDCFDEEKNLLYDGLPQTRGPHVPGSLAVWPLEMPNLACQVVPSDLKRKFRKPYDLTCNRSVRLDRRPYHHF